MELTEIVVAALVVGLCLFSVYNSSIMVMFQKKGITTYASKNSIKNVRIHDARVGMTYIYLNRRWVEKKIYDCEVYPVGDRQHQKMVKFNFDWFRASVLEPLDKGTLTIDYVRPEDYNSTYADDHSLLEESPHIILDRLERAEEDNVRLKAQVITLEAIGHQQVRKVLEEVGAMVGKSAQSRGGFQK